MGFRGLSLGSYFVAFTAVIFLSACGQDEAPYQAGYGNPGVVPQSGAPGAPGVPGGQPGVPGDGVPGDGAVVNPTDNPILTPSGVAGPMGNGPGPGPGINQPIANPPGNPIQNGPAVAVAPAPLPAPVPPYVAAARNYFAKATLFLHGRQRSFAWNQREVDHLMNIVFTMRPGFNIEEFDLNYRIALDRGWRGYVAYDEAFRYMGMCIATCKL